MTRRWIDLERELQELERTDPAVRAAAESYDRMRDTILRRADTPPCGLCGERYPHHHKQSADEDLR